jgi:hypothetical protein
MDNESYNLIWLVVFVFIFIGLIVATHIKERSNIKEILRVKSQAELAKTSNDKAKADKEWALKQEADNARAADRVRVRS